MLYKRKNEEVRSLEEAEQVILSVEEYKKLTFEELQGETVTITKKELHSYQKALQIYKESKGKAYGSDGKYKLLSQRLFNYNSDRVSFLEVRTEFVTPYSIKELNYEDAKNLIFLDFSNAIGANFDIEIFDGAKAREKIAASAYKAYHQALRGEINTFNFSISLNGRNGFFEVVLESAGWIPAVKILEELNSL